MLWDHLTLDPNWLGRYTGLRSAQVRDLRFELLVHELYGVRRYAAKLGYEIVLHGTGLVRRLPSRLRRLEAMYPPLTRPRYRAPAPPPAPLGRVALLLGCV
ncbi:MAG: hypothetical protein HYW06_06555, partial [Gemmatimonadetes bacterium]|nr:hypothetical protein [Gemmatimonadota bacterium]